MFFKDAGYRFPQFVCRANVNMVPLFAEVFEPHIIHSVTDEDIRVILFKIGQLVACVFNRVQFAVDYVGIFWLHGQRIGLDLLNEDLLEEVAGSTFGYVDTQGVILPRAGDVLGVVSDIDFDLTKVVVKKVPT